MTKIDKSVLTFGITIFLKFMLFDILWCIQMCIRDRINLDRIDDKVLRFIAVLLSGLPKT